MSGVSKISKRLAVPIGAAFVAFAISPQAGELWRLLGPSPAHAQETRLSIEDARKFGFSLLAQGQPAAAKLVAQGLLQRDATDVSALLILSRAERLLGDYKAAAHAGRAAWRVAQTPTEQYAAALVTAQAISAGGSKLRAQFWLRRAAQVAPNDALRQQAAQDFRYVRATSLASVQLRFSVAPSSNINNGSRAETVTIVGFPFGIPAESQALSGLEYRFGATLRYRLPEGQRLRQSVSLDLQARAYSLSSSAQETAPSARASDYAFQQITLGYQLDRTDTDGKGQNFLDLGLGANWYGGDELSTFFRATAGRRIAVNRNNTLRWSLSGERQWRQDTDTRSATTWTLSGDWFHARKNADRFNMGVYLRDTSAFSAGIAHQAIGAQLGYSFAEPVFAETGLSLGLGIGKRRYDRPLNNFSDSREDLTTSLSATLTFRDVSYYGFSPTATLSASRTSSNIDFFDTEDFGIKLGLASNF